MSLAINVDKVTHVLLADGWHSVVGRSFCIDSYEYVDSKDFVYLGGGQSPLVPSAGFVFKGMAFDDSPVGFISGPLTAIIAVFEEVQGAQHV